MPELEEGQAPVEGTPEQTEQTQEQVDWQKRYEDLRPQYDRTMTEAQENRRYREAVEALNSDDDGERRRAADLLGLELEEPNPGYSDPQDELARKFEAMEQRLAEREQAEQTAATEQRDLQVIGDGLRGLQEKVGRDLSMEEITLLGDAASANRDAQGQPNIGQVCEAFLKVREADQQSWAKTKPNPPVGPGGQAATHTPNLDDMSREERVKWMADRATAMADS